MQYSIPAEPLWAIFTPEVITKLRRQTRPSQFLNFRLHVLTYNGMDCPVYRTQAIRAHKSAWEAYLSAAFACGLFEDPNGADLIGRLTGVNDNNFRSAMSECLAAWYFAGLRQFEIQPRPKGGSGHLLEFMMPFPDGDIHVEVKAPYRPVTANAWYGDDANALQSALKSANKQFAPETKNLLVIVPSLRVPISDRREQMERAFIGESIIEIPIDTRTGGPAGPARFPFKTSGAFTRPWRSSDDEEAQQGYRHTRVGAVLFLDVYPYGAEMKHQAFIVHNPNAMIPLPRSLWQNIPEFFQVSGQWNWSDRVANELEYGQKTAFDEIMELIRPGSEWLTDPKKFDRWVANVLRDVRRRDP